MLDFLTNYWWVLVIAFAIIVLAVVFVYKFIKSPSNEQIKKVKEWLLYAVTAAEKELGQKTGQIKLAYVYDMFLIKFPSVSRVMKFETFSLLVDEVLEKFRNLLESNSTLEEYIGENKE